MMKGSSPVRMRPGGGMNANLGNFSGEHFDESVAQQAYQQKSLSSSAADPGSLPSSGKSQQKPQTNPFDTQAKPRSIDPKKEPTRFAKDVLSGVKSLLDIHGALAIDPIKDTPEQQAKKRQFHKRMQEMTQEEKAYADKLFQEKMEKQKLDEKKKQEEEMRKQQEDSQSLQAPSGPQKGPVGPAGSKKQKAVKTLQQNRQGIGKMQGAN